ncbi:MAG TPA: DUF1786 domain-containing protein [Candidatus Limnocylindrales bacterium]|nr:DUF1786 domain-containing protein [Candidatus Limnocylindrales bacterium]
MLAEPVPAPRILAIDVGTGTQDVLVFEGGTLVENSVQLIMPSPTVIAAGRVQRATAERAPLLITGVTMGGGPVAWAVEAHLRAGLPVRATADAARTFDDDLTRVAAMGVQVIEADEAARRVGDLHVEFRDLYLAEVKETLQAFGAGTDFDAVAVAVFDHGAAPPGYSDRRFRFDYLKEQVGRGAGLEAFGFLAGAIPDRMTRMQAVTHGRDAAGLFVMDTGPAAVLGALDDARVRAADRLLLVNVGNFHTLAFLLDRGRIAGLFEHHTGELTTQELERYLEQLVAGTIANDEVFADMGHGALEPQLPPGAPDLVVALGPRRRMLEGSRLTPYFAVPHGDMMLAGCFGLLRALAHHRPELRAAIEAQLGPPAWKLDTKPRRS